MTDRYSNGKIYKLVSDVTSDIYIGSTCMPLHKRLCAHKANYNRWLKKPETMSTSSKTLFSQGGNVKIILIELYEASSKDDLLRRERHFIENMICVNKLYPIRTETEVKNQDLDRAAKYYIDNKADVLEKRKIYAAENKAKIAEYQKQYKITKKAITTEKIQCAECAKFLQKKNMARHIKIVHKT